MEVTHTAVITGVGSGLGASLIRTAQEEQKRSDGFGLCGTANGQKRTFTGDGTFVKGTDFQVHS